jgi:hypothetical protein
MVNATGITAISESLVDIIGKLLIMRGDRLPSGRAGAALAFLATALGST